MTLLSLSLAWLGVCFTLGWAGPAVRADDDDETLRGWLAKADLVAAGTIASEPIGVIHETGVPNYLCDFKVTEVLKGDAVLAGKVINANIVRFELVEKDKSPLVKKGGECILFLKNVGPDKPVWQTADFWFGIQSASPWLARSLKRLDAGTTPFHTQCEWAEDKVIAVKDAHGQTLTIKSSRGIGSATITRRADAWPNPLKLRFNLKSFSGLTVGIGKGKFHRVSQRDANVKQVDGGVEVVLPREWLGDDVKSLTVHWIDVYR